MKVSYVGLRSIAEIMEARLNFISRDLKDSGVIENEVVFNITPNRQVYDRLIKKEYVVGNNINHTPSWLQRVFSTIQNNNKNGLFIENYLIRFYGFKADEKSLEIILDTYTQSETQFFSETIQGWKVTKRTSKYKYESDERGKDGSGKDRITYSIDFEWTYVLGGVIKDDATFKINGEEIDVISYTISGDKRSIANVPFGDNNRHPLGASGIRFELQLPVQIAGEIGRQIYNDILSKVYNKVYKLEMTVANYIEHTFEMELTSGRILGQPNTLLSYVAIFNEKYERTEIKIDGVTIPVLEYRQDLTKGSLEKPNKDDTTIKGIANTVDRGFSWKVAYDPNNPKCVELYNAVRSEVFLNIGANYKLETKPVGQTRETFNVFISGGSVGFSETPDLFFDITFSENHEVMVWEKITEEELPENVFFISDSIYLSAPLLSTAYARKHIDVVWQEKPLILGDVNYSGMSAIELPTPYKNGLKAKVSRKVWVEIEEQSPILSIIADANFKMPNPYNYITDFILEVILQKDESKYYKLTNEQVYFEGVASGYEYYAVLEVQ